VNRFGTTCLQTCNNLCVFKCVCHAYFYVRLNLHNDVARLTTQGCNNIDISWLYQTCWNNLATSLIISTSLLQVVNSLFQTCWQLETSSANTTCWRLVGRLATRCEIFTCVPLSSNAPWCALLYILLCLMPNDFTHQGRVLPLNGLLKMTATDKPSQQRNQLTTCVID
jgi:hypothetical protein